MKNSLYCGDNLSILREHIADESVDLIYLDPPFNSDEDYNVILSEDTGQRSTTQKAVFEDTWSWHSPHVADVCREIEESDSRLGTVTRALHAFLGDSQMMAYLVMMAPRLTDLYRVLKPTGSLYLHCDSTASHYLKMLLDAVFTPLGYRNEIIWKPPIPTAMRSVGVRCRTRSCTTQRGNPHGTRNIFPTPKIPQGKIPL